MKLKNQKLNTPCRVSIEFSFYLNLNFVRKIEATYSIACIYKPFFIYKLYINLHIRDTHKKYSPLQFSLLDCKIFRIYTNNLSWLYWQSRNEFVHLLLYAIEKFSVYNKKINTTSFFVL